MSILFLKSEDNQTKSSSYNPNKPYRFSNYLTQPLTIPPNSQVAYVSSQFNISANGTLINEPSYFITTDEMHSVLSMPATMQFNSKAPQENLGFPQLLNDYSLSINESGMEDDFTGLKYTNIIAFGETQNVSDKGFQMLYDVANDKAVAKTIIRTANDRYNLDFNCCRTNPNYDSANWVAGGSGQTGATISAGLNWDLNIADLKFYDDCRFRAQTAPAGNSSFKNGNCYGLVVDRESNLFNARNRVYEGGANFYNTGWTANGLDGMGGRYNNQTETASTITLPNFTLGQCPMLCSKTGIKKCVGDFTPTNTQQNNRGGHQTIGHLNSGGYAMWTMSNARQSEQNRFYDAASCNKVGFTGFMECSFGVHSLPFIQQWGYDEAKDFGESESLARNINTQIEYFNTLNDLNASDDPDNPVGALARYLFGVDMRLTGTAPNITLEAQAKVANCLPGYSDAVFSRYENLGNALDIQALSRGVNTATTPPYTFDLTADYSINCFDTTSGRTPAMLFFRFRWENKTQMVIEFTLSVDGFFGTYNNATDEPYAPSQIASIIPPPSTSQTIRLDGTTTGNVVNVASGETINFLDSGGAGGDYNPNENYNIVFVAPVGQVLQMTINSFQFEQSNIAYDRLGIRVSDDGVNWVNISEKGFQSMQVEDNPNNPSDSNERIFSVPGQPQNSNDGWIFPTTTNFFTSQLGGDISKTFNFGARYMQFRFISDGSGQEPGWDLNIFPTTQNENDPRNKWCLLARMNNNFDTLKHFIPSYMGDMCLVQYPLANTSNTSDYYSHTKGYYNIRRTNRYFDENSNALSNSIAPLNISNPFYAGEDTLGVLRWNSGARFDDTETSENFIQSGFDGSNSVGFNSNGILVDEVHALGIPFKTDTQRGLYRTTIGTLAFQLLEPRTEIFYQLGFNTTASTNDVVELLEDAGDPTGATFLLLANDDISQTSDAFSNHIQITNLPIFSQNGVISGVNKTIYVVNSLCIEHTMDTTDYRSYCDKAPFPLWVDLNNLETIQLNKVDILISKDDNTEQKNLIGESEIVVMFRQRETGTLPNSIQSQSIPMTRTY